MSLSQDAANTEYSEYSWAYHPKCLGVQVANSISTIFVKMPERSTDKLALTRVLCV